MPLLLWTAASADLAAQPLPGSCTRNFRFCDNCATPVDVTTRKNRPCAIRYWITNGAIFGQRVTKRGNGIYGTSNSTIGAYQPKPNYVGKDYFEVEIAYERAGSKFKTTLQASVTATE